MAAARFEIERVFGTPAGTSVTGRLVTGKLHVGDVIQVIGPDTDPVEATVAGISLFAGDEVDSIEAEVAAGLLFRHTGSDVFEEREAIVREEDEPALMAVRANLMQLRLEEEERRERLRVARELHSVSATAETERRLQVSKARLESNLDEQDLLMDRLARADSEDLFTLLDNRIPIALFPVRLETRIHREASPPELLVRVFPDDLHVDTHEPALTSAESEWGLLYWKKVREAEGPEDKRHAWQMLVEQFGSRRAAWIAREVDENANPSRRSSSWTRAPFTHLLPDFWWAEATIPSDPDDVVRRARSGPIPHHLIVGPDPHDLDAITEGNGRPADSMHWMTDFLEAEKVGMALRVPLADDTLDGLEDGGIVVKQLLVVGIKASQDVQSSSSLLKRWVDGNHYTKGVSFLPHNTPTNNTAEEPSGYTTRSSGYDTYDVEQGEPMLHPDGNDSSDGARCAEALGIAPEVFAHVGGADSQQDDIVRAMNTVLWPTTWDYFFKQMLAGDFFDREVEEWTKKLARINDGRSHFIDWVRGRGPLPALRVGRQPYGLLPVTSLKKWETGGDFAGVLAKLLGELREEWEPLVDVVPQARGLSASDQDVSSDEAYGQLIRMLELHATSQRFYARPSLTRTHWLNHILARNDVDLEERIAWITTKLEGEAGADRFLRGILSAMLNPFGRDAPDRVTTRLGRSLLINHAFGLCVPIVSHKEETLEPDYLRALLEHRDYHIIQSEEVLEATEEAPLLYLLLRNAALLQHGELAFHALRTQGQASAAEWGIPDAPREEAVDDIGLPKTAATTKWVQALENEGLTTLDLLEGTAPLSLDESGQATVENFNEFWHSLRSLQSFSVNQLEQTVEETLDLASYRLDAWITSLATRRLFGLRRNRPEGVHIGGYGWIEELRLADARNDDAHFIHAPSVNQATAATVLRNGYLTRRSDDDENPLALDISSHRMRQAVQLYDGVRNGLELGELLGYRFERWLRDDPDQLDGLIPALRRAAPLVAGKRKDGPTEGAQVDKAAEAQVVDGLALLRLWQRDGLEHDRASEIEDHLTRLADMVDAMKDLALVESVFQNVAGSNTAATATLEAISRGEAPPPEGQFLRTGRRGITLTHRVLVLLQQKEMEPSTERAQAAPYLAAWAASLLPPLDKVLFHAQYREGDDTLSWTDENGTIQTMRTVILDELSLAPLDYVYLMAQSNQAQQAEWERRVAYYLMKSRPEGIPATASVHVVYEPANVGLDRVLVPEFWEVARALHRVISGSRALAAEDLHMPLVETPEPPDAGERSVEDLVRTFADRIEEWRALFEFPDEIPSEAEEELGIEEEQTLPDSLLVLPKGVDATTVAALIGVPALNQLDDLRESLMALSRFGVPGCVPRSPASSTEADRAALVEQCMTLHPQFEKQLARAQDEENTDEERLQALFGAAFRTLPQVAPPAPDVRQALSQNLVGGNSQVAVKWFMDASRVRSPLRKLGDALLAAEAVNEQRLMQFHVSQLPFQPDAHWIGLPLPESTTLKGSLSMVLLAPDGIDPTQNVAGLFIDEWAETVPERMQTTGITFQYDAPGAEAPNAILLAVPPNEESWQKETLVDIVRETLELAHLRSVDLDAFSEGVPNSGSTQAFQPGHFLPAIYLSDAETDLERAACLSNGFELIG